MIYLNVIGLALFFIFGVFFLRLSLILRPALEFESLRLSLFGITLTIVFYFLTLLLHELVHGLFFLLFTHDIPKFGFKGIYAFAAAPEHYLSRLPYVIIGLAPFFLITLVGLVAIVVLPQGLLYPIILVLTVNASGAVGDLYIVGWLLTIPGEILINDQGDGFEIYKR